ncbi:reverse transcriptase domain-containing protein [Tanacetum coccineum]
MIELNYKSWTYGFVKSEKRLEAYILKEWKHVICFNEGWSDESSFMKETFFKSTVDTIDHDEKCAEVEEEGDYNEVQAVSFYPKIDPIEPLEWKASKKRLKPSSIETPKLELKKLPEHLEYVFLQKNNQLLVVISSALSAVEKSKLLETSSNPNIKEVMKKEVIKILDARLIYPISDSPWVSPIHVVPKKGGMTVVKNEKNELIPQKKVTGWRICIDYRKLNNVTQKYHFPLPFIDQMLKRLTGHEHYYFLDGFLGYFEIPIALEDQEKTTLTCPYGTFAYKQTPFRGKFIDKEPATFQRCTPTLPTKPENPPLMTAIFHELIEDSMEVFMEDFFVLGNSFDHCLKNLEKMLKRCEETNLVLNWEKCHFMVKEESSLAINSRDRGLRSIKKKSRQLMFEVGNRLGRLDHGLTEF